ncbi:DUF6603 domain-containing protein [Cellulomonas sp. McL0617]|uniref:DUF6603 domain-containing protein n=1 Tax=Cellulomonas sp. McL0617 TaxID=3415675 RepID=UPI003CFA306C
MSISLGQTGELDALARALGLLDEQGDFDQSWFQQPLTKLEGIVRAPGQRTALLQFFDLVLPPEPHPGRPASEKWHPLLGDLERGNLYLTLRDTGSGVVLGLGGDFHTGAGADVPASLRFQADVVEAGSDVELVIGTTAHPLAVEARVQTGWTYNPAGGRPVGLAAVTARFTVVPDPDHPSASLVLVLEQLSLGGETPADSVMDVEDLGRHAPDLLAALLKIVLAQVDPDATLTSLSDHLLALFGLADADDIPAFPFADLPEGPAAVQRWMGQLLGTDGTPTAVPWLEHLAGLLGQTVTATGTGSVDVPWRVPVAELAGVQVYATLAQASGHLRAGLGVSVAAALGPDAPELHLEAEAALVDVPLDGVGAIVVVPRATALLRLTGAGDTAVVDTAQVKIGTLRAGLVWDGSTLTPTLELLDARLDTTPYPRLDLTNVDSVAAAAVDLVVHEITDALGTDVGRRLAALVGLVAPEDPANPGTALPGWTHHLDLATFVVDPATAIGTYHRAVLQDGTSWDAILREVAHLIGLDGAIGGTGSAVDPWTVAIAGDSPALQLTAWHAPDPAAAGTEQLRIGLRLATTPATFALVSELLTFDLADGAFSVGFLGAQELRLVLDPAVDATIGPVHIGLDTLEASAGWRPGQPFGWHVRAAGLSLSADGDAVTVPELHLPPAVPFDLTDLAASAAGLGVGIGDLENLLRLVLSVLASTAGDEVEAAAGLLGLRRGLPGMPEDSPLIVDPSDPGRLLRDPLGALRLWLGRLVAHVGVSGESSATALFRGLGSLGEGLLGAGELEVEELATDLVDLLDGAGTFDDPWRIAWPGAHLADGPRLETWLEPAGPPTAWLAGLGTRVDAAQTAEDLAAVLVEVAWFDPDLRSLLRGLTLRDLTERLRLLEVHLGSGDGVVPRDSQGPDIFGWAHGAEANAAHPLLPQHPDVVADVVAQVERIVSGGNRCVLLVGPAFVDHTVWSGVLASPDRQGTTDPAAHVDLRTPGIDPRTISLDTLTAVADWYTVDLADNGSGDTAYLADQIAHVADRLAVLHPGALTIVAHSYAGLAARTFVADHPGRVTGLITIGTPHLGTPLAFLQDQELGDALRIAGVLAPALTASPLADALAHLTRAVEGYRPAPSTDALAVADPYPEASFSLTAPFDIGADVAVVTMSGSLSDDVLAALRTAVSARVQTIAGSPRPAPTHLAYGIAMPVPLPDATPNAPHADARVRYGLGQIALVDSPAVPPHPAQLLRVELELSRPGGWLVGGPAHSDVDGRLRRLQLGVTASHGGSGPTAVLDARLDQAAWRGTTVARAALADAVAAPLIGAGVGAALAATDSAATTVSALAAALGAIDLLGTDATGTRVLSADGFAALRTDPVGFLGGKVPGALAATDGWAGLIADGVTDGSYLLAAPGTPYELFVRRDGTGWRTGIQASTAAGDGDARPSVELSADVDLALPAFTATAEVVARLGIVALHYRTADGTVTLDADPFLTGVRLWPTPSLPDLAASLDDAIPQVLASGVVATILTPLVPGLDVAALLHLLRAPGEMLSGVDALGLDGGGFDAGKVAQLLTTLNGALRLPAGPGLQLPGDIGLTVVAGSTPGSIRIGAATTSPIEGVLGLGFAVEIDASRHVAPAGSVTIGTPLTGSWPHLDVAFGADPTGLSLVVTPQGVEPITILPTFSGLGALRGAAGGLLPQVLDAAVDHFATPHPDWLEHLLAAAGHLDLYDPAGKFSAHTASFTAMLTGTWFDDVDSTKRGQLASAVVDLLPGVPGTLDAPGGGLVRWRLTLPDSLGSLQATGGWGLNGPTVGIGILNLRPVASAPAALSATVQVDGTGVDVSGALGADLSGLGVALQPRFAFDIDSGGDVRIRALPLASGADDGPLVLQLAPAFTVTTASGTAEQLIVGWALPLALQVALAAAEPVLDHDLWTGGPTLTEALTDAGILVGGHLASPLPGVFQMLGGFLAAASSALDVALGDLHVRLLSDGGRVGIGLSGHVAIPIGELQLDVLLGAPTAWGAPATGGLELFLIDTTPELAFDLGIHLRGVGVGLEKSDGTALVSETWLRLGAVKAYVFLDLETRTGSLVASHGGGGLELGGFGLPISAALGGGGGSNPVASNLLSSGGSGGAGGDGQSVNPVTDVDVWYWDDAGTGSAQLHVLVGGQGGLFWIPIHAGFGPIFIDQLGIGITSTALTLAIDGGLSVAGLSAEVDDLSVTIPFAHVTDPSQWSLDLKGLAVGYSGPAISIAGGLVKFDGPPIEYDGMLLVKIGSIGAIVIGSYSVVGSGSDEYTSFAIFGGVFVPIGLPPVINLTGIALGLGYNRRLIVPEDLNKIPDFMLVKALDNPEALANNPMQALYAFRDQVPPSRGALWFAAGLRGTMFEVVNVTAVLYVALDGGIEIGLLGVARMALPTDDAAIVSIELAMKARFSSAEGLFSIQAQLTDNSWLISKDCQLTGGFAFFTWFRNGTFLLTLGGYHPSFKPLPEYPIVPRLGFRWSFLGVVQIKGESYFAITSTAFMTGVRMEATYGPDWLQIWFTAYTDILITRDPFHYELDVGIEVGGRLRIRICFFACATIEISVSVGASLHLSGPPFHGTVTADLGVTSVTVPFGDDSLPMPPAKTWAEFVDLYVRAGDAAAGSVGAQVSAGLLPAEPAGAPVAPGTADQPWRLSAEWALRTESKMPARGFALQLQTDVPESQMTATVFGRFATLSATYEFDLAPMHETHDHVGAVHSVVLARQTEGTSTFVDMVPDSQPAPADRALVLDPTLFRLDPLIAQVSEATYHFFADFKPPAAANTLPVLNGLEITGVAGLHDPSDVVPIGTLVDATNYRPLPFARNTGSVTIAVKNAGAAYVALAATAKDISTPALMTGVASIVGGSNPEFAELRTDSGLRSPGYGPAALDALANRRSAPPVLSSLAEGFTLDPVGIGTPPPPVRVGPVEGVALTQPRVRAVLQRPVLVAAAAPAMRTTVPALRRLPRLDTRIGLPKVVPVVDVRHDLVTSWDVPGSALLNRPTTGVPQPTRAARSSRTLRNPALGGTVGRAAGQSVDGLTKLAGGDGVTLRSGSTHLWELPRSATWTVSASGDSAVRITELSTAGTLLADRELPAGQQSVMLVDGCGMVALTALGVPTVATKAAGAGAVTGAVSAGSSTPVLGWQLGSQLAQVGPTTLLARGSVVRLSKPFAVGVRGHVEAAGIVPVTRAMLDQELVRTDLPASTTVIGVLVDGPRGVALGPEQVVVHTGGADVAALPLRVTAGNRTMFLYDLLADDPAGPTVGVSVGVVGDVALAGVVGAVGNAAQWAAVLAGSTLTQVVPDEHLTPDGSVQVRLMGKAVHDA